MSPVPESRETAKLEIDARLLAEARRRGIDASRAAEAGIADAMRRAQTDAEAWREENREAIESWNAYVERNGLPLAAYRLF
jgi:antitoxin CcdA